MSEITMLSRIESKLDAVAQTQDYSNAPGRKHLLAGDRDAGFFGFVEASDFITGSALATALTLSAGNSINSDSLWIKYMWRGRVCFTPLKPHRRSITWDDIYAAGAVYASGDEGLLPPAGRIGADLNIDASDNSINTATQNFTSEADSADIVGEVGDSLVLKGWSSSDNNKTVTISNISNTKIIVTGADLKTEAAGRLKRFYNAKNAVTQNAKVTIKDLQYTVRLFQGAASDPTDKYADADRGGIGPLNEWNSIILPLHEHAKLGDWNYPQYAGEVENWGVFLTDEDLVTHSDYGYGSRTWCQEVRDDTSWRRGVRGYGGASYLDAATSWFVGPVIGFRPVLELPQTATL